MRELIKRVLREKLGWGVISEVQRCTMLGPVLFSVLVWKGKICGEVTGFLIP